MTVTEWLGKDNIIGIEIWKKKYQKNNETFDEWLDRVCAKDENVKKLISEHKFMFGGRVLSNRGLEDAGNLFNCFSLGYIEDDYGQILDAVKQLGMTFKAQGGQGISLSKLRPKGSPIGKLYESDGILPFMRLYNSVTAETSQGGCIFEDELVLTPDGNKKIKDIQIGDFVWTKVGFKKVTNKWNKGIQPIFQVTTQKGYSIKTTEDHKYCVDGFNVIPLNQLKVGDNVNLIREDSNFEEKLTFDEINSIEPVGEGHVYDIEVEDEHKFYCNGFYVSNSRKGALMISLDACHKEALNFITVKNNDSSINKANLSLEIDDRFMNAVEAYYSTGEVITLHEKREYSGHIVEYDVVPIEVYKAMCQNAYDWGDPACLFVNQFRNRNIMEFDKEYQIISSNPSLRAGTLVLTEDGYHKIEELENKKFKAYTINQTWEDAECFLSGKNKQLYKISLDNESVYYCTPEHKWPVYDSITKKWTKKEAKNMTNSDRLIAKNPVIDNLFEYTLGIISVELTDIKENVWDIHVYDDTHTFHLTDCVTGNCGEVRRK